MNMLKCQRCGLEKEESEFNKCKTRSTGYDCYCRICQKERYIEDKQKRLAQKKEYYQDNKEKIVVERREHRANNKEKVNEQSRRSRNKRKDAANEQHRQYYQDNRATLLEQKHEYYQINKVEILDKQLERSKKRYRDDIVFRLKEVLRSRLRAAIKNETKTGSAVRDLGCSISELKAHLEAQFYPHPESGEMMTWENYGLYGWHIDHIEPLNAFDLTNRERLLKACHYTNLQPLWAEENLKKGAKYNE